MRLPLRIGTRSSPMALAQTRFVRDKLSAAHPDLADPAAIEIVAITTVGDKVLDRPLAEVGGKGLFVKELEQALLEDRIDLAVHSMKDVETWLPDGLEIACILKRDDPRDAFLSHKAASFAELPAGSRIGTSSLRRAAQIRMRRPDLTIVPLRGNANTRLRKLAAGECDAMLLAICGLQRLGLAHEARDILSVEEMLPAVAQGALGIECRSTDADLVAVLQRLACPASTACLTAERALLKVLDGSCRTPIAALAEIEGERLHLRGLLAMPDGSAHWTTTQEGPVREASAIGQIAGTALREDAGSTYTLHLQ